jgi:uridine phosphorylase
MLRSYLIDEVSNLEMEDACKTYQLGYAQRKTLCNRLFRKLENNESYCWFYGPQGRILRLNIQDESLNSKMDILSLKRTELLISKWKLQQYMVFRLF